MAFGLSERGHGALQVPKPSQGNETWTKRVLELPPVGDSIDAKTLGDRICVLLRGSTNLVSIGLVDKEANWQHVLDEVEPPKGFPAIEAVTTGEGTNINTFVLFRDTLGDYSLHLFQYSTTSDKTTGHWKELSNVPPGVFHIMSDLEGGLILETYYGKSGQCSYWHVLPAESSGTKLATKKMFSLDIFADPVYGLKEIKQAKDDGAALADNSSFQGDTGVVALIGLKFITKKSPTGDLLPWPTGKRWLILTSDEGRKNIFVRMPDVQGSFDMKGLFARVLYFDGIAYSWIGDSLIKHDESLDIIATYKIPKELAELNDEVGSSAIMDGAIFHSVFEENQATIWIWPDVDSNDRP